MKTVQNAGKTISIRFGAATTGLYPSVLLDQKLPDQTFRLGPEWGCSVFGPSRFRDMTAPALAASVHRHRGIAAGSGRALDWPDRVDR